VERDGDAAVTADTFCSVSSAGGAVAGGPLGEPSGSALGEIGGRAEAGADRSDCSPDRRLEGRGEGFAEASSLVDITTSDPLFFKEL
jgi:hypothetical protein